MSHLEAFARRATLDDVEEIVRLAAVMFMSMGLDPGDDWDRLAGEALRARLGDDVEAFVVDHPDDDGLVSCGVGTIAHRLPGPLSRAGHVGYIQWIATDEPWRRRGFSRAVMQALLDWYDERGIQVVELHATSAGEPLYRSFGFTSGDYPAMRLVTPRSSTGRTSSGPSAASGHSAASSSASSRSRQSRRK